MNHSDHRALCLFNTAHCTTSKKHSAKIGPQVVRRNAGDLLSLAADKGYDWMALREELRDEGVRPLIKHRLYNSLDHAHNAPMDSDSYNCRWIVETAFSVIKRTLGLIRSSERQFVCMRRISEAEVYEVSETVWNACYGYEPMVQAFYCKELAGFTTDFTSTSYTPSVPARSASTPTTSLLGRPHRVEPRSGARGASAFLTNSRRWSRLKIL